MPRAAGLPLAAQEREFLEGVVNSVADPIFVKDGEGRYVLLNDAACAVAGRPRRDFIGRRDAEIFPADQAARYSRQDAVLLRTGQPQTSEELYVDATGEAHHLVTKKTLWTSQYGRKFLVGVVRDMTEQVRVAQELERSRESLRHARRMELLGRLAGGVAHDFNNFLMAMRGCAGMVLEALPRGHAACVEVREIQKAGEMAGALTRQLLSLSRRPRGPARVCDLREVVTGVRRLLERLLPEGCALHVFLPQRPVYARLDAMAVERILLNLVVNAGDAMPRGGRVVIEVALGPDRRAKDAGLKGRVARMTVRDEGEGMDQSVAARAFEAEFTTKERGSGLGLSIVRDAVEAGGGRIAVESAPGRGAAFHIWWPAVESAPRLRRRSRV